MERVWIESQQCWSVDKDVIAEEEARIAADPNRVVKPAKKKAKKKVSKKK